MIKSKLTEEAKSLPFDFTPKRATEGSAGYDL